MFISDALSVDIGSDSVKNKTKLRGIFTSLTERFKDRVKLLLLELTNA
jgi:hypothetical protein